MEPKSKNTSINSKPILIKDHIKVLIENLLTDLLQENSR